jgi:hypothetical protein
MARRVVRRRSDVQRVVNLASGSAVLTIPGCRIVSSCALTDGDENLVIVG